MRPGWRKATLGQVCELRYGKALKEADRAGFGGPVFGSNGIVGHHVKAITDGPTIVVGRKGSHGEVTYSGEACWPIDTTYFVDSTCTEADLRWLFHCISSLGLNQLNRAAAVPGLNREDAYRKELLLPPIEEQRRIASILDAADALRSKRRQALEKLDTLTQSIFIDMFGDPIANDRSWPERTLRDVCQRIQIGPFGSLLHQSDYEKGGIPIVNPMHIVDGAIRARSDQTVPLTKHAELANYQLRQGDVVMGRRGEMGRCAVVGPAEDGWLCGSGSLFFRPDLTQLTPLFLAAALSSPRGRDRLERLAQGVTMLNLNSDMVESFVLGLPPVDSQARFVAATTRWSELAASCRQSLSRLDALFSSLQYRAFRGEM